MIGIVFLITLSLSSCRLTSPAQPISLKKLENFWSTREMRLFSGPSHLQQKTQDIHMCIKDFLKCKSLYSLVFHLFHLFVMASESSLQFFHLSRSLASHELSHMINVHTSSWSSSISALLSSNCSIN